MSTVEAKRVCYNQIIGRYFTSTKMQLASLKPSPTNRYATELVLFTVCSQQNRNPIRHHTWHL